MVADTLVGPDLTKTQTPDGAADFKNLDWLPGHVWTNPADGRKYKFVLMEDAAAVVGDGLCYTTDDNRYEVTRDRAGGTSDNNQPAGLARVVIADGDFGWIQIKGLNDVAMVTDGGVSAGEALIPHATTDGGLDSSTADADTPYDTFGQALDDDVGTVLAIGDVLLDCPE